jgi:hypothetical protein
MDPATIISLALAGAQAVARLIDLAHRASTGQELGDADRAVLKQEQAAAEARLNADLS